MSLRMNAAAPGLDGLEQLVLVLVDGEGDDRRRSGPRASRAGSSRCRREPGATGRAGRCPGYAGRRRLTRRGNPPPHRRPRSRAALRGSGACPTRNSAWSSTSRIFTRWPNRDGRDRLAPPVRAAVVAQFMRYPSPFTQARRSGRPQRRSPNPAASEERRSAPARDRIDLRVDAPIHSHAVRAARRAPRILASVIEYRPCPSRSRPRRRRQPGSRMNSQASLSRARPGRAPPSATGSSARQSRPAPESRSSG